MNGLFHALGQGIAEPGQRHRSAGAGKFYKRFIKAQSAQYNAQNDKGHQNFSRCQFCVVDQQLPDHADQAADQKSF